MAELSEILNMHLFITVWGLRFVSLYRLLHFVFKQLSAALYSTSALTLGQIILHVLAINAVESIIQNLIQPVQGGLDNTARKIELSRINNTQNALLALRERPLKISLFNTRTCIYSQSVAWMHTVS